MLMYGSNFWRAPWRPRETSRRPMEADAIPLPSEETTPPVTKMKRVRGRESGMWILSPGQSRARSGGTRGSRRLQQLAGVAAGGGVAVLGAEHAHQLAH